MNLLRRKPNPVRVQLLNGLRMDIPGYGEVIELLPGKEVRVVQEIVQIRCDRGFSSDDAVHRLEEHVVEVPMVLRLAE